MHRLRLRTAQILPLLGAALGSAGCLVSDPPKYEEPGLTPPFLDLVGTDPLPGRIIQREQGTNPVISFKVPVRSEDNGENLWFSLYRNFSFSPNSLPVVANRRLPPGTFDETDRSISFDWTIDSSVYLGCHQLTLLVSHESTWNLNLARPDPLASIGDSAMAVWWLNYYESGQDPAVLNGCPTLSSVEP